MISISKSDFYLPQLINILPFVDKELASWEEIIEQAESNFLKEQGLASIRHKKFHCQGGNVFSGYGGEFDKSISKFIIAFQTISDYLDNLCDRSEFYSGEAFAKLHLAMLEVFYTFDNAYPDPDKYYLSYPWKKDGGYLLALQNSCREQLQDMPYAKDIRNDMLFYTKLYTELQVFKHLHPRVRVNKLQHWYEIYLKSSSISTQVKELKWWEFACAAGSTLSIFALLLVAQGKISIAEKRKILNCYFPWICSLHILLDYLIDQEEDKRAGDLNFVCFYKNREDMLNRIVYITDQAYQKADSLIDSRFHITVISGLLAIYLSDSKIEQQNLQLLRKRLLYRAGRQTIHLYYLCKLLRKIAVI